MNREQWLHTLAERFLWPRIEEHGGTVCKKYRISCGWPLGSRGGKTGHAIGQCWSATVSGDGTTEIFVSPKLEATRAVDVLLHELVHASVGMAAGHGPKFKKLALAVGLAGPMKATVASEALQPLVAGWLKKLPAYPHAPLNPSEQPGAKKPGSRLLKAYCSECGYTVRITKQWVEVACPTCPDENCERHGKPFEIGD